MFTVLFIVMLGCDRFKDREAAHASLSSAMPAALAQLRKAATSAPAMEARWRAAAIVRGYFLSEVARVANERNRLPWIDGPEVIEDWQQWVDLARNQGVDSGCPHWPAHAAATRLWLLYRMVNGLQFREKLRQLWMKEWLWRWRHQDDPWCW